MSVGQLGWEGVGKEFRRRLQRDKVWRRGKGFFFCILKKTSLHSGPTSVTAQCLGSIWGALHHYDVS